MKVWVLPPRSLKVRAATAILCRWEETGRPPDPRVVVRTLVRSRIWPGQTRSGVQPQRTPTRSVCPDAETREIVNGGSSRSVGIVVPTVIAST